MTDFHDIDDEIDYDMGWSNGQRRKKGKGSSLLVDQLRTVWHLGDPLWRMLGALTRRFRSVAFFPVISPLGYTKQFNLNGDMVVMKRSWGWRLLDGLVTRLLLTPLVLALFLMAIVYTSTHPARVVAARSPDAFGIYYKRVNLLTVDNERLSAWYVPPLTVDEFAVDPDGALTQRWPSVVLCHGLGAANDQYLGLTQELHRAGFAVLLLDTRGQGESDSAPVTYGLRERLDVLAAVKYLRETPSIDPMKVCVAGHDIGATAALQAAALDSSIAAVVADGLWPTFDERTRTIFARPFGSGGPSASWLAPLYTMAFEISVRDRLSQLDPNLVVKTLHTQPVLFVARSGSEFAPVQEVLTLATTVGAAHQVIIAEEAGRDHKATVERQVVDYLVKATNWKGPNARAVDQIQKLLKNRIDG